MPSARPPPLCAGSRDATPTPASASRIPVIWSGPGRSPEPTPTANGITAATAEIGATMPIAPIAIPR